MFGKKSIIVYNAVPKETPKDEDEIIDELAKKGLDKEFVEKVLDFMEKEGVAITVEEEQAVAAKKPVQPAGAEAISVKPEKIKPETIAGSEEEVTPPSKPENEEEISFEEETPSTPSGETSETTEITPEEIKPVGVETTKPSKPSEEIQFENEGELPATSGEEGGEESGEAIPPGYTDVEADIYKKFGDVGAEVYRAAKEGVSVQNIMVEHNLSEDEVKQIMDFLQSKGYLAPTEATGEEAESEEEEESRFAPLSSEIEETSKLVKPTEKEGVLAIKMKKMGFTQKLGAKFGVVMKFKKRGRIVFDLLSDGNEHDEIEIIRRTKVPVDVVEKIINYLKAQKLITTRLLNRAEIRRKFGYDSLTVYRKYGKKGVIMYDFVGRDFSLKQIATLAGIKDKDLVFNIFVFIHKLLGIDMPIDKDLIMKQLE